MIFLNMKLKKSCLSFFLFLALFDPCAFLVHASSELNHENKDIQVYSDRIAAFYELGEHEKWREVTNEVLASPDTPDESKNSIRTCHRKIYVFKYPSDGLWIKGFISFTPNPNHHPLLIIYRWGNEDFALMNPGVIFATYKDYTVISSALRGGVSQGKDEFGGADVDDMKNLMTYMPQIAKELSIDLHPSCIFMLGPSRGGLQMFLTLSRFPELQQRVNKVVTLSAILDLHQLIKDRPQDMKLMLEQQFGLKNGTQGESWVAKRNPINTVPLIKKNLPILIVQGSNDQRISLSEGYHMVNALEQTGHDVNYWEVPNGDHTLTNTPMIMNKIALWLESNSPCMSIHVPNNH